MKRILSILCLAAVAAVALGAGTTAQLTWTAPTQYIDGTALPATDIASYTITWAPVSGQQGPHGSLSVAATALASPVPVPCGSTTFSVSVTTTATATYANMTSGVSNAVPYASGVTCVPLAPTNLKAQ